MLLLSVFWGLKCTCRRIAKSGSTDNNVKKALFSFEHQSTIFHFRSTYKWFKEGGTYFWVKSFSISKEAFVNGITPCWRANIKQLLQNRKSLSNLWSIKVNFASSKHTIFQKRTFKVELEKFIIHDVENILHCLWFAVPMKA